MIDIVDALDLLDRCVRDRRVDAPPAQTDGIVAMALSKAGTPLTTLGPLSGTPVADAYASGRHPLNLTLGAVAVFRAAESAERRGQTWAMSLQAARLAASRFVELIPDRIVGRAAEAEAASHRAG
jgi:hypothetical protein